MDALHRREEATASPPVTPTELGALREIAERNEWIQYEGDDTGVLRCGICKAWKKDGHADDCPYARLRGEKE